MKQKRIAVIGDNLDAIIFLKKCIDSEYLVDWYRSERLAGHFVGVRTCNKYLDVGMVLYESEFGNIPQIEIQKYNHEYGFESLIFQQSVNSWIIEQIPDLVPISIKTLNSKNDKIDDFYISDSLSALNELSTEEQIQISNEIRQRSSLFANKSQFHPQYKRDNPNSKSTLEEYIRTYISPHFFEIFYQDFMNCILGENAKNLFTVNHRRYWLPLYWPESVHEAINNSANSNTLCRPFLHSSSMSISHWINSLIVPLTESQYIKPTISRDFLQKFFEENDDYDMTFYFVSDANMRRIREHSGLSSTLELKNEVVTNTNSIRIVHFCTTENLNETLFLQKPIQNCYRINYRKYSNEGSGNVSFEFGNSARLIEDDELLKIASSIAKLFGTELLCNGFVSRAMLPTNGMSTDKAQRILEIDELNDYFLELNTYLYPSHSSGMALNDNILRGLSAIKRLA